ncbi:MAG: tRNA (N(6)-L-threonylcarbamoyladenosine(37)-C(2))-methylthiotransferase MtaB, partial [Clostridia bacterium]|nr:tRNA (N(6)-L-threonylcarbamoyladenosine(37)-C(2))-methylthiotransferase MtaB [Clostridia bacterium]
MNIIFHTLGCKVNQYETEVMREALEKLGHTCDKNISVDAVVINSCTVTAESDRKTRQLVRRMRRQYPDAIIAITGCMVQAFPDEAKNLTDADIIIGNRDVSKVIDAINKYNNDRIFEINEHQKGDKYNTIGLSNFNERTRAFMKIEDGCDRFCTYCIIPYARGRVRSRAVADIKAEAERLAQNGFCEIVLVGINLTSYGKGEDFNLCDAVDAVCQVEGIKRVRLGSLEPDHITDQMLARFKAQEKF